MWISKWVIPKRAFEGFLCPSQNFVGVNGNFTLVSDGESQAQVEQNYLIFS